MKEMYKLKYHLEPVSGWMNDPNGLVEKDGVYHIYYQYSYEPEGGLKYWKQFTTKDFLHYQDEGIALSPDHPHDQGGAYSGCCFNDHGLLRYFYTGNVKLPGDYDYINAGREHNVMVVDSQDGLVLDHKEVVLYNKDYPQNMSCHVRDPFIYENDGMYYMVLGARTLDSHGCVILYSSKDLKKWDYMKTVDYHKPFGYMWECPNYISFEKKKFLFCCPQGLESHNYDYEAIYQNGYFPLTTDLEKDCVLEDFIEFDHGFDIYAQQFFKDEKGRMIMAGWMGLPDIDYTNPTVVNASGEKTFQLLRLSQVYCWYAEATGRAGEINEQAVKVLNEVRNRADGEETDKYTTDMSPDKLAEAAYDEHGWEMAGYYWGGIASRARDMFRMYRYKDHFESRKLNKPIEVAHDVFRKEAVAVTGTWDDSKMYVPYPYEDVILNPNLDNSWKN